MNTRLRGKWGLSLVVLAACLFVLPAQAQITYVNAQSGSQAAGAGSVITYVNAGAAVSATGGNLVPPLPASLAANDLLICMVGSRDNTAPSMTGWTSRYSITYGSDLRSSLFWKIAGAAEVNPTVTYGGSVGVIARCFAFRGVDPSSPFDVAHDAAGHAATTSGSDKMTTGSLSTASNSAMILIAGYANEKSAQGGGVTTSGGLTWLDFFATYDPSGGTNDVAIGFAYASQSTAAAIGPLELDTNRSANNQAVVLALKPSPAGVLSINKPVGVTANDVMVASIAVRGVSAMLSINPPAGWTQQVDTPQPLGGGVGSRLSSYYKVAGAAEPASYAWSFSGAYDGAAGGIAAFRGVDVTTPVDVAAGNTTASASTHTANQITTTAASGMLVSSHEFASSATWSPPVGMAEMVDVASATPANDGGISMEMNYAALAGAGATGNRIATAASPPAVDNGAAHLIALRPALHHVRVEHDGAGDTCAAKTVTVKACIDASCSSLYSGSVTTTLASSSGTWASNPVTFSGGSTSASLTVGSAGTVTVGASQPANANNASDCYNVATGTNVCTLVVSACSATCATTLTGVVNTYYPGAASVVAGATSLTVGTPVGASVTLRPNDLVLIVQMQDATINTNNSNAYGANLGSGSGATSTGNSGLYEYKVVSTVAGSTVTFSTALVNGYTTAAATSTAGQKTFQMIRVPVLASYTLSSAPVALAWDGSAGGVLAFDVTGVLTFSGSPTINVNGQGFAGGVGRQMTTGSGANTDYRTNAGSNSANGAKGEGIAGRANATDAAGNYGYPNGSNARGAPGNAGGGGTDGNPSSNDQNTGGGGGAGYGSGGLGGIGWCGGFNATNPPNYGCSNSGGLGGTGVTSQSAARLIPGGGGGSGTSNNNTGTPPGGLASSGAAGGGLIFVRAGSLSGSATFSANGADANNTVCNDGSGGGGAGGAVLIQAGSGIGSITINVRGGTGGTNLISCSSGPHGPGGGGGGGYAITSAAPASCVVSGGLRGDTYNNGVFFGAYGSVSGSNGLCVNNAGAITTPGGAGTGLGAGPCVAALAHYAISYPLGNPGVTCEALAVRVTGHNASDAAIAPPAGTQITLASSPATGGWALKTGTSANFTGGNKYAFDGSETFAEFWLTQTTALANIDLGVSDGTRTEKTCASSCDGSEDERAQFANAAFRFYADTAGTLASIGTQTAGVQSGSYYLRAIRTDTSTGVCTAALQNQTTSVNLGYQCNNPATCYAADLVSVSAAETKTVARNNNGSSASGTSVSMAFDSNGYAPFSFNYKDVGEITLLASKTLTADNTKTPPTAATTLEGSAGGAGANGGFVVKPYGFKLSGLTCAPADIKSSAAGAFCVAGGTFTGTVTAVIYDSSQTNNLGAATQSFGREATAQTVSFSPSALAMPTSAAGGTLSAFTSSTVGSFSGTPNVATTTMVWPNVGTITIKPTTDYLGSGDISASGVNDSIAFAGNVGRFYPDHFTRVSGAVTPACSTFTYMGQPNLGIAYTVEARNKSDATTSNYFYAASGGYPVGTVAMVAENADAGTDLASSISGMGTAPVWTVGQYAVTATTASFFRNTTPDGPYDALAIGVRVTDPDANLAGMNMRAMTTGACTTATSGATDCNATQLTVGSPTKVRYGRLTLGNAYGSELLDLPVSFRAEFWNGTFWAFNSADTCTGNVALGAGNAISVALVSTPVTLPTCVKDSGNPGLSGAGCVAVAPSARTFRKGGSAGFAGDFNLWLQAPGAGHPGSSTITATVPVWLRGAGSVNPTARATFGIYKTPLIYRRENY